MKSPWVLYLSDYQVRVYRQPARNTLEETARFSQDAPGQEEFSGFLDRQPCAPVSVLVDVRQEEYLNDSVPHVWFKDRWDMLNLRLRRLFSGAAYTYAQIQEREQHSPNKARKNDHALFMSLSAPENVEPWLKLLLAHKIPVRGLHSVPLLGEKLFAQLPGSAHTLLLAHTPSISAYSVEGLRQSYFLRQRLAISRLLPLTVLEGQEYAQFLLWEATKAQQYLGNLNLLPEDRPLRILLLGHAPQLRALREYSALQNSGDLEFQLYDIHSLAAQLGLKHHPQPLYLSELTAYLVLQRSPRNHYARPTERRYYLSLQARRGLWLAAWAALTASGGYAGWIYHEGLNYLQHKTDLEQELAEILQRNAEAKAHQREQLGTDIDVLHIKNTVEAAGYLKSHYQHSPYPGFVLISQVLDQFPQLALLELEWQVVPAVEVLPAVKAELDAMSAAKMGRLAAQLQSARRAELSARQAEKLRLSGQLAKYDGNAFTALQIIKQFAEALRKQPQVHEVKESELPLLINPNETVRGDLGQQHGSDKDRAGFTLEIILDRHDTDAPAAQPD